MNHLEAERLAGLIVDRVFGGGYISPAAAVVFNSSKSILCKQADESHAAEIADSITKMCQAVGSEAAAVGFG